MTWNQSKNKEVFNRRTCPICGNIIESDHGIGSMELSSYCVTSEDHYRKGLSIFSDSSIRILNKCFDAINVNKIDEFLDEIGDPKFK